MLRCFVPIGEIAQSVASHFKEPWNSDFAMVILWPSKGRVLTIIENAALRL
jgi:hypothetical protein